MAQTGITEATVEEIKIRTELSDLISSYGIAVQTAGASKKACCPFHNEKTPSFNINDSKGFYHCFGCGESGDAIKFVQKMEGLSFVEAVRKLAGRCGVKIEEKEDPTAGRRKILYALMAELAEFYRRCLLQTKEAEPARAYLSSRALGPDIQEAWTIGYAPTGTAPVFTWAEKHGYTVADLAEAGVVKPPADERDRGYHRFGGRLMFTIRDRQGRVVAFSGRQLVANRNSGKYVNSPETLIFRKSNVLFGFDKAAANIAKSPHREAIVCEGQIDTIRLHASGFPVAVASQGTAFTEEHVQMLRKAADQVVLCFDDDGAGHKATIRTAGLCLAAGLPVRVVSLPGGDDPDSFLRTHPKADFERLLDNAESIMSFQVRAERQKEARPDTVDALARITKGVLATIAQSQNEVVKAALVGEAAKLLGLPTAALTEELVKLSTAAAAARRRTSVQERTAASAPDAHLTSADAVREGPEPDGDAPGDLPPDLPADTDEPLEPDFGEEAAKAEPPGPREFAFCEFLMANEYDRKLDATIGEFLPPNVYAHPFTRTFVEVWRTEVAGGEDAFAPWRETLGENERGWFDRVLLGQGKSMESMLSATDILQDFVRSLWADALGRRRGALPATGDAEADRERMRIALDLKRLQTIRWPQVKELIRDWMNRGISA